MGPNEEDCLKLAEFMMREYGINLTKKQHLIISRLGSVISAGKYRDFHSYVEYITSGRASKSDLRIILNKLTTNHTYFMRENTHFDFLTNTILPELEKKNREKKSISIWSAGCSSGQEPYTISMLLFDYFGNQRNGWDLRVLATDISNHVMSIAKKATYTDDTMKDVPEEWKKKYMIHNGDSYTFVPEIRHNVIFKEFNLMDAINFKIPFDVIFCRNVMIYFDNETKNALVNRFYDASNPGAYLLIGQSETLPKDETKYTYVSPATYRKAVNI
jgi:chemotaxis protein methyltransferase CheR